MSGSAPKASPNGAASGWLAANVAAAVWSVSENPTISTSAVAHQPPAPENRSTTFTATSVEGASAEPDKPREGAVGEHAFHGHLVAGAVVLAAQMVAGHELAFDDRRRVGASLPRSRPRRSRRAGRCRPQTHSSSSRHRRNRRIIRASKTREAAPSQHPRRPQPSEKSSDTRVFFATRNPRRRHLRHEAACAAPSPPAEAVTDTSRGIRAPLKRAIPLLTKPRHSAALPSAPTAAICDTKGRGTRGLAGAAGSRAPETAAGFEVPDRGGHRPRRRLGCRMPRASACRGRRGCRGIDVSAAWGAVAVGDSSGGLGFVCRGFRVSAMARMSRDGSGVDGHVTSVAAMTADARAWPARVIAEVGVASDGRRRAVIGAGVAAGRPARGRCCPGSHGRDAGAAGAVSAGAMLRRSRPPPPGLLCYHRCAHHRAAVQVVE